MKMILLNEKRTHVNNDELYQTRLKTKIKRDLVTDVELKLLKHFINNNISNKKHATLEDYMNLAKGHHKKVIKILDKLNIQFNEMQNILLNIATVDRKYDNMFLEVNEADYITIVLEAKVSNSLIRLLPNDDKYGKYIDKLDKLSSRIILENVLNYLQVLTLDFSTTNKSLNFEYTYYSK